MRRLEDATGESNRVDELFATNDVISLAIGFPGPMVALTFKEAASFDTTETQQQAFTVGPKGVVVIMVQVAGSFQPTANSPVQGII